jgi:hypothetical protein
VFAASARERIELCHPSRLGCSPLGRDPGLLLQPVQSRVERSLLNLKSVSRDLLDTLGDSPAVFGLERNRFQDQKVECSLDKIGWSGHDT